MKIDFSSVVWAWEARVDAEWFFVSVPAEPSEDIRDRPRPPRGFGAVRVRAQIGSSVWATSIFPMGESGEYALPLKRAVRDAEGLAAGAECSVSIELLD